MGRCGWCRQLAPVTAVGHIEVGSGPGALIYACTPCMTEHRILPFDQHPDGTDGQPRLGQVKP